MKLLLDIFGGLFSALATAILVAGVMLYWAFWMFMFFCFISFLTHWIF